MPYLWLQGMPPRFHYCRHHQRSTSGAVAPGIYRFIFPISEGSNADSAFFCVRLWTVFAFPFFPSQVPGPVTAVALALNYLFPVLTVPNRLMVSFEHRCLKTRKAFAASHGGSGLRYDALWCRKKSPVLVALLLSPHRTVRATEETSLRHRFHE